MIRTAISLLRFYATHPSIAVSHAGKALAIIASQGPRQFLRLVRARANSVDHQIGLGVDEELQDLSARIAYNRIRNAGAILETLIHYADDLTVLDIVHGTEERLRLVHCHILKKYQLLDEDFYRQTYLSGNAGITPADHYSQHWYSGTLKPNAFFDPFEYLKQNADVASFGMDPVIHFALFGWREGRSAGSAFDASYYLQANPDVADLGLSPLIHFLGRGRQEHRAPLPPRAEEGVLVGAKRTSGTILLVCHDAQLGGAQQVVRIFANWLLSATLYDVKLVVMAGGPFFKSFSDIAPSFDVSAHKPDEVADRLKAFAGPDVKAVFINSVASGGFFKYWQANTPAVAFIHELPKLLSHFSDNLELIKQRAGRIVGGSEAVRKALLDEFGVAATQLATVHGFIEYFSPDLLIDADKKRAAKIAVGLDPNGLLVTGCGVLHWRKSPDKFVAIAEIAAAKGVDAKFIWIGGGPDQEKCEELVRKKGLQNRVSFTGYEPNIMRYLNASDIFLLPSEEDPFPLVCLYAAMALNPIICFEEAGGVPELVSEGGGAAVPFGDVQAMAEQVVHFASDRVLLLSEARKARTIVQSKYTVATKGPQLLHYIRETAGLSPFVSVVVPNYNYETFLDERLRSIADQTFQDFEVILLDDHSSDSSVSVMERWRDSRPGTQLIVNEKNSGSPFAQWMRGMKAAKSELIWIAEADDTCSSDLLSKLLPYFEDRNVFLGYVKSVPIGKDGTVLGDYEAIYLNRVADGRWSHPYVATDHEEANEGLGIANCIPNASSVVFRRFDPEPTFESQVTNMKMCGDWLFYLRAMRGGFVVYTNAATNYHRRHVGTVTHSMEGSPRYFEEFTTVRSYVFTTYRLNESATEKIMEFTRGDMDRFGITDDRERERILSTAAGVGLKKAVPSVLFVASDMSPGGGQMFVIRLANAWMRHGGRAVLLNAEHFPDHAKVVSKIDSRVSFFRAYDVTISELRERFDLELAHSAIWWADRYVLANIEPHLPWVSTMHGCHETLLDNPPVDLSFPDRFRQMLKRVDGYVHTADKNMRVFSVYGKPKKALRIVNGVDVEKGRLLTRQQLGIRENAIGLCLATRAIPEKGWHEAVEITTKLNEEGLAVDLMLIGEGPAADVIQVQGPAHVHLYGQVDNLHDFLDAADVVLLPSTFVGESMPLILLEAMAKGTPVVATDVGEIPSMLGSGSEAGGIAVPLREGQVDIDGFCSAIKLLSDLHRRESMGKKARKRFEEKFTTSKMIDSYENLYRELILEKKANPRKKSKAKI